MIRHAGVNTMGQNIMTIRRPVLPNLVPAAILFASAWYFFAHSRSSYNYLGVIPAVLGVICLFIRKNVTIDRNAGIVTDWWSLFVPLRRVVYRLAEFHSVRVWRNEREPENEYSCDGEGGLVMYSVCLNGPERELVLNYSYDPLSALKFADKVAAFAQFNLMDASSGRSNYLPAGDVGRPLQERAKNHELESGVAHPPPDLSVRYYSQEGHLRIVIPPSGFTIGVFGMAVGGLAFIFLSIYFTWNRTGVEQYPWLTLLYGGTGLMGFALALAAATRAFTEQLRLMVSSENLCVQKRHFLFFQTTRKIKSREIIQVGLIDPNGTDSKTILRPHLFARTSNRHIKFGAGLPVVELRWIQNLITNSIVGTSRSGV